MHRREALAILTGLAVPAIALAVGGTRLFGHPYECNVCGRTMPQWDHGAHTQQELACPFCGSRPRHRVALIYFTEKTDLFSGRPRRMLHIAPEPFFVERFKAIPNLDYLSGDLDPKAAMVQMDITDIQFPDNSFDVIYCSHVLEHVPDDRKAMRELARVLKPSGWAVLAVPVIREKTVEDPTVTTDEDRFRVYGQHDHVRAYGPDFVDRLRASGFDVTVDAFTKSLPKEQIQRFGLSQEDMYLCRKRTT